MKSKTNKQLGAYLNKLILDYNKIMEAPTRTDIQRFNKEQRIQKNYDNTCEVCEVIENKIKSGESSVEEFSLHDGAAMTIDLGGGVA